MKEPLSFQNNLMKPQELKSPLAGPSGPFCPLTPQKDNRVLKGGAMTSAFMSAFL